MNSKTIIDWDDFDFKKLKMEPNKTVIYEYYSENHTSKVVKIKIEDLLICSPWINNFIMEDNNFKLNSESLAENLPDFSNFLKKFEYKEGIFTYVEIRSSFSSIPLELIKHVLISDTNKLFPKGYLSHIKNFNDLTPSNLFSSKIIFQIVAGVKTNYFRKAESICIIFRDINFNLKAMLKTPTLVPFDCISCKLKMRGFSYKLNCCKNQLCPSCYNKLSDIDCPNCKKEYFILN